MSETESPNGNSGPGVNGKSNGTTSGTSQGSAPDDFDLGISGSRPSRKPAEPAPAPEPVPRPRSRKAAAADYEPVYEESPRKPKTERADAFNATAWLIEGIAGMMDEIQHNDLGLPEDFWVHAYAARKEGLLAARALIDHAIQRSDEELAKAAQKEEKRTRRGGVDIDFDA